MLKYPSTTFTVTEQTNGSTMQKSTTHRNFVWWYNQSPLIVLVSMLPPCRKLGNNPLECYSIELLATCSIDLTSNSQKPSNNLSPFKYFTEMLIGCDSIQLSKA